MGVATAAARAVGSAQSAAGVGSVPGFAFGLQLLQSAAHELPAKRTDVVDEQSSMQMVDLVLEHPRVEALNRKLDGLAIQIKPRYFHYGMTFDLTVQVGKTEATLLACLRARGADDAWVDPSSGWELRVLSRHIDHDDLLQDTDLGCGQADTLSGAQRGEQLLDQAPRGVSDSGYRAARLAQYLSAEADDFAFHCRYSVGSR